MNEEMKTGMLLSYQSVKEQVDTIKAELKRKGIEKDKGLSVLEAFIDNNIKWLNREQEAVEMNEISRVARYLKSCKEAGIDCTVTIDKKKTHLILDALIKQIPMKVEEIHVDEYRCPACGAENTCGDISLIGDSYCPECGQAIYQQN